MTTDVNAKSGNTDFKVYFADSTDLSVEKDFTWQRANGSIDDSLAYFGLEWRLNSAGGRAIKRQLPID
jgi:hypothetical protein